jgi:predicted RNA-binding Zn-ribbon protein involved in translation (DUF1610 family)
VNEDEEEVDGAPSAAAPPPLETPHVPGSTRTAGTSIDDGKGRVFPCTSCGADMRFEIGRQSLVCPSCGHETKIDLENASEVREQRLEEALERLAAQRTAKAAHPDDLAEVRCDACGANVEFKGALTSTDCPYCTKPLQRGGVHESTDRIPVDGVLPFLVGKAAAEANLRKWVASRWFLPNDFKRRGVDGKLNGTYVPFWTYDSFTANVYRGERGDHYYVTVGSGKSRRQVRRTRWSSRSGAFQRFFDDVLVCAAQAAPRRLIHELEPWPLARCTTFEPGALAGFFAETYSVDLAAGFAEARERIRAALNEDVRRRIGGDEQRIHQLDTRYDALSYKHLLLPVWLLAYTYAGKVRHVAVNAATGEVQGQRPWSWVKITLLVLAIAAVIAAGVLLYQGPR